MDSGCKRPHRASQFVESDLDFASEYQKSERRIVVGGPSDNGLQLVFQIPQNLDKICTVLWPSGVLLAEFVATELRDLCKKGGTILELGCGSALPSMVAACLGANVVATDMDLISVENAMARNQNVLAGALGSITTEQLPWGEKVPQRHLDAVLVADAIYKEDLLDLLAETLAALVANSPQTPRILLAYQIRNPRAERKFFGPILQGKALCHRDLNVDRFPHLSDSFREFIRVVEIYPETS